MTHPIGGEVLLNERSSLSLLPLSTLCSSLNATSVDWVFHTLTHKKRERKKNQRDRWQSISLCLPHPTLLFFLFFFAHRIRFLSPPPSSHPTTRYIGWKYDWSGKKRRSNPSGTSNPISCYDVPQSTSLSLSSYRSKANGNSPPPFFPFSPPLCTHHSKSLLSVCL